MTKIKHKKIGLALSGGSALGIAHIGALKALEENKIEIACIAGTSAGAVVAACYAFDVPLKKMIEISQTLSWSNISKFGYSKLGLNSNKPVGKIILETIGDVNIEDARIPLAIVATDIDSGEKVVFRKGKLAEAVMASTCIPVFFAPVKIGRRNLVDGGLVENLPLSPLAEMGAELEVGIDLGHWHIYKKTKNIVDIVYNSYGILLKHQENSHYDKNKIVIKPHLEKFDSSDFKKVKGLMQAGYMATESMLTQIKKESLKKNKVSFFLDRIISRWFS